MSGVTQRLVVGMFTVVFILIMIIEPLEGFDILDDLMHRCGVLLTSYHQQLQESLMPLLMDLH